MVHKEKMKIKDIANQFNIDSSRVNAIYAAAVRRFGSYKTERYQIDDEPKQPIVRPKAEYSNKNFSNYSI